MPPRFSEILDSEDEDDLVAVKALSAVATFTSGEDAPVDLDVDHSSASTAEQLRRAHLALMAPTQEDGPVVNFSDLAATSAATSPSSTHKKRSLIETNPEPRSSGKLKRIKIVTKPLSQNSPTDLVIPPPILPFDGTSDTIPGPTLPSLVGHDMLSEKRTPKPRKRNSSQQQSSSADQNSLTPWSGTALGSSDKINSDDAVGLPKEMYQPRPSRSRSAQVDNSHVDYTMVVEKAIKKAKPKRSITDTADNITSEPMFPKHSIDQAPPFERLSPSPESPTFEQSIQLDSTVPESIQEHPSSSKSSKSTKRAAATKPPAKRGRPKKQVIEDEEDELAPEEDVSIAKPKTPKSSSRTEVQVVIESRPDPALAASVLAQLRQHKSREPTPKLPPEPLAEELLSEPPQAEPFDDVNAEHAQDDDESEDDVVKPKPTARIKAQANPKAKSKTPEPVYKEEDASVHEDEDEVEEEVVKPKSRGKGKSRAKPKARGKAVKAVVAPDPPSDHEEEAPEPPLVDDDQESEADHISEAEEDSEEESPKPKAKAKPKAKPESKAKAKPKAKAATSKPAAATPKPTPPEAETPKPAIAEAPTPAAIATPKVATVKKDAKSSAKPSWQQSTYRVGLSKTQRIPSLLKVFKK
ncbi:hypothetical protein D6D24_09167 [Aureobasidium pullulans]|uniref:Uncharacterized protein n=1 Tax=Aureobasidium pullulans TaxID=5580 RepID=A0A4S8VBG8_AURPU|nr:hypothetical protein D6D24_09167 [Aureobasidium pullulans]